MATNWPNDWLRLTCSKGHELKTYDHIDMTGRLYCVCDICGAPEVFTHAPLTSAYLSLDTFPERVILPASADEYIDIPPLNSGEIDGDG